MKKGMIILLIISLVILSGLIKVNATTVNVTEAKFNLYTAITRDNCNSATSYGYKKIDTAINITEKPYISRIHYLFSANLQANQSYTLTFVQGYNPKASALQTINTLIYRLEGGTTDSNLSANNISSFKCFATNDKNNPYKINITCNFVPLTDIKKIWIEQLHPNCGTSADYFNTYTVKINANSSTEQSINNQTEVIIDKSDKIINEQQETNEIISQDHNYNTNPSQSTENEKQQMENYEQQEDTLRNGLDLNIEESEITINPQANTFIWNIVDKLRGMSGKIVLLFTSVLSLGIMKMILGR